VLCAGEDTAHGHARSRTHRGNLRVGRATERATIDALLGDAEHGVAGALTFTGPRLHREVRRWSSTRSTADPASVSSAPSASNRRWSSGTRHCTNWCCCKSTASRDCPNPNAAHATAYSHARNAKARAAQQVKKGNLTADEKKQIDRMANKVLKGKK
jgi:hypothetical protein